MVTYTLFGWESSAVACVVVVIVGECHGVVVHESAIAVEVTHGGQLELGTLRDRTGKEDVRGWPI